MSSTKRILIVDDEPTIRTALELALDDDGFEITTVDDGDKAVDLTKEKAFDLVVMDVRMPRMDGLAALGEMGRQDAMPPVILATSHGTNAIVVTALKLGASGFLTKPMKPGDVRLARDKVLSRGNADELDPFEKAMALVANHDPSAALNGLSTGIELDTRSVALRETLRAIVQDSTLSSQFGDLFSQLSYQC